MKKHALLVGVNGYSENSGLMPLRFAEADAHDLSEVLHRAYGFSVTTLLGEKATRNAIEAALLSAGRGDVFLFFFAGHGQLLRGQYRLHPIDSASSGAGSLAFSDLAQIWHQGFGYPRVMALIDACRNEARALRGNKGLDSESMESIRGLTLGERWVEVIYGCSEGQVSYEVPELGHGVFTNALLDVLQKKHNSLTGDTLAGAAGDWMRDWCGREGQGRLQEAYRYYRPSLTEKIELLAEVREKGRDPDGGVLAAGELIESSRLGVICWESNHWTMYPLRKMQVVRAADSLTITNTTYVHSHAKVVLRDQLDGSFESEIELVGPSYHLEIVAADGSDRSIFVRPADQGVDTTRRHKLVFARRDGNYHIHTSEGKRLYHGVWRADGQMTGYLAVSLGNGEGITLYSWNVRRS